MRSLLIAAVLGGSVALTGCAVKKDFYAMGGSRADGTVEMAYDFAPFESPKVSTDQAKSVARSKCKVWGYEDAEAFGGQRQVCNQYNGYGSCIAGNIIVQYQCIGNLGQASTASQPVTPTSTQQAPGALSLDQWKAQQISLCQTQYPNYQEYMDCFRKVNSQ